MLEGAEWQMPDVIKALSLNESVKGSLPEAAYQGGDRVARYLLVSQDGAVTLWHTDFTGTTVFYAVLKGTKAFHVVRPTEKNRRLFDLFRDLDGHESLFFGSHPDVDVVKVEVHARQAICMPAGVIHCVETFGDAVALG